MNAEAWTGLRGLKIELTVEQIDRLMREYEQGVRTPDGNVAEATGQFLSTLHAAYERAKTGDTRSVSYG